MKRVRYAKQAHTPVHPVFRISLSDSTHLVEVRDDVLIGAEVSEDKLTHNGRELVAALTPLNCTRGGGKLVIEVN